MGLAYSKIYGSYFPAGVALLDEGVSNHIDDKLPNPGFL